MRPDAIASAFDDFEGHHVTRAGGESTLGRTIGSFELECVLGEGGFGVVYLAHQRGALPRKVALKVLRSPLTGGESTRRFERERRVLARLEHPSIASIYEAGVSDSDQPYFAMEYVAGPTLIDYCSDRALPLRARLELLVTICSAVHHAHEHGVVHRDLKPANIIVATVGGAPLPKVIDFGIAKLSLEQDEALTLRTRTGQVLGTPEYMSPEQADGAVRELDARSDVYSLGVLLYELVTGTLPLLERGTRAVSLHEVLRVIRDVEPPRPSTRLSELHKGAGESATPRSDPPTTARRVRGDLDWVCLRALEKDPARRYATARELAADLTRVLEERPVLARRPSRTHMASRFVRRHRTLVAAAALVTASLVAGIAATTYSLRRAIASGDLARAERTRSDGRRIAAEARLIAEEEPTRALLLGLEAARLIRDASVNNVLLTALTELTEQSVLEGHQRTAWGKGVFLREGRLFVTATDDPLARVWDPSTGALLRCLDGGGALLEDIAASSDGRHVATAAQDGRVMIFDVDSGAVVAELPRPPSAATTVEYDPTGTTLAVAYEGQVCTFDAATGVQLIELGQLRQPCRDLEFSASGAHLAVSEPGILHVFRVRDGLETARLDARETALARLVRRITAHPTQELFAVRSEGDVRGKGGTLLLDATGAIVAEQGELQPLCFSPDGRWLVGMLDDGAMRFALGRLDLHTGAWERSERTYEALQPLPLDDGLTLWASARRTFVEALSPPWGTTLLNGHRYAALGAALDPATRRIATWSRDRTFRLWRLDAPTRPFQLPVRTVATSYAMGRSPAGVRILCKSTADPTVVQVFNVDRGLVELELPGLRLGEAQLSPNGARVVAVPGRQQARARVDGQREVHVFDVATGATKRFDLGVSIRDFAVCDDGSACVLQVGVERQEVRVLDLDDGTEITVAARPQPRHLHATLDRAADLLVLRVDHQRAALVRASDGVTLGALGGHGGDHRAYALSADGRRLLSTGVAGLALVRDVASGATLAEYRGLDGLSDRAGFARDGALAWAQTEEAIHLFDPRTGAAFARLLPRDGRFCDPVESADGQFLLTVTTTGWFQRWPLDPVAYARQVAPRELEPEELEHFQIDDEAQRLDRMEAHARAIGTGTRFQRVARIVHQKGDLDRALRLLEEGVATGTTEEEVWQDLFERLCEKALIAQGPAHRGPLLDRAAVALRRIGELGLAPSRAAAAIAPELLAEHAELRALASE